MNAQVYTMAKAQKEQYYLYEHALERMHLTRGRTHG